MSFKVDDLVTRNSHNNDVVFKIVNIDAEKSMARLKGVVYRLEADSPLSDLKKYEKERPSMTDDPKVTNKIKTLGKNRKF